MGCVLCGQEMDPDSDELCAGCATDLERHALDPDYWPGDDDEVPPAGEQREEGEG